MKKAIVVLLSLMMVFMFVACGEEEVASEPVGLNEAAVYEDVSYTVTDVEHSNGGEWDTPEEGNEYVIVTVEIENNSEETIDYNEYDWKMLNSQGQLDDVTFITLDTENELSSGSLTKGGKKVGKLVFEEPKDESLTLQYFYNELFDDEPTLQFVLN